MRKPFALFWEWDASAGWMLHAFTSGCNECVGHLASKNGPAVYMVQLFTWSSCLHGPAFYMAQATNNGPAIYLAQLFCPQQSWRMSKPPAAEGCWIRLLFLRPTSPPDASSLALLLLHHTVEVCWSKTVMIESFFEAVLSASSDSLSESCISC